MMEWRMIREFSNYEVSEDGRVRRARMTRGSKPAGTEIGAWEVCGYPAYHLCQDGVRRTIRAYRLVAEAFLGPPPTSQHEVAHFDGDRRNSHYKNLRWATRAENHADKRRHGTHRQGEAMPWAKITEDGVREIRRMYADGMLQREIAEKFGLGQVQISRIVHRSRWAHVQ